MSTLSPDTAPNTASPELLLPPSLEASRASSPQPEGSHLTLKPLTLMQLFNLSVGIIGIQFAWSMQIALSSKILEPLGADPFLYGLIWCAGPITGIVVQPLVGAFSDRIWTPLGRRRPFILGGAILGSAALLLFPFSRFLWVGALLIWLIDACVNMAQGPYRALVPDIAPPEQTTVANAYMNTAFGIGSCIALGVAPVLKIFHIIMSLQDQYIMAALALLLMISYSSALIREYRRPTPEALENKGVENVGGKAQPDKNSLLQAFTTFLSSSPEIHKVCLVQFFTWVGMMCMFIYLTPYVAHTLYKLPDRSELAYKNLDALSKQLEEARKPLLLAHTLKPQTLPLLWQALHTAAETSPKSDTSSDSSVVLTSQQQASNATLAPSSTTALATALATLGNALPIEKAELESSFTSVLNDYKQQHPSLPAQPKLKEASALAQQMPFSFIENKQLKNDLLLLQTHPMQGLAVKQASSQSEAKVNKAKINKVKEASSKLDWSLFWKSVAQIPEQLPYAFSKKVEKKSYLELGSKAGQEASLLVWAYTLAQQTPLPETLKQLETLEPALRQTVYQNLLNQKLIQLDKEATDTASKALVALNLLPLLLSVPMGFLASRLGKKQVYTFTLACMALAFGLMPLAATPLHLLLLMGLAGVAWSTILSIPFAFLCDYMKPGQEGSIMGIFNMFIAAPQLISAIVVGKLITLAPVQTVFGSTHNWPLAFQIASASLVLAIIALQWVKEAPRSNSSSPQPAMASGGH